MTAHSLARRSEPVAPTGPRVRFAPSPTGFLHVGGARTAIFNWLFARRHAGTFVLRIEDTDLQRSSDEVVRAILDGMEWLGMQPDEGPFFQSAQREAHVRDARRALEAGYAYRCFCSAEAAAIEREAAEREGRVYLCPSRCRDVEPAIAARRVASDEPFALRFKVPAGTTTWDDLVHGPLSFDNSVIEDFVLLRSDVTPTYQLSVVSDDIAMRITHVIRGDDHISNTPKQILLYRALGANAPTFGHLPLILGEDKKRLSKRHGATSVLEYRDDGYLPEAVFNFLALLGWSPGDDRQKMTDSELIGAFSFAGVSRAGAVFDVQKLEWLNGQYIAALPVDEFVSLTKPRLQAAGLWREEYDGMRREWLRQVAALVQPRCKTLADVVEAARPLLDPSDEYPYEEDAAEKHLAGGDVAGHIAALRDSLADVEPWERKGLEAALRRLAETRGVSAGKLIHPTRLAVTGRGASPGIFEVLEILGRERSIARMERLVRYLSERGTT